MWLLFSLFGGILDSLARVVIKVTKADALVIALSGFIFSLPIYGFVLWLEGWPSIGDNFNLIVFSEAFLMAIAIVATARAHQLSPLILTVPYLSLTTVFLLVTSPLLKGGLPNNVGLASILLISIGLYLININKAEVGLLGPLKNFKREKGSQLMLLVALIYSVTANLDNLGIKETNLSLYLFSYSAISAALLLFYAFATKRAGDIIALFKNPPTLLRLILFGCVLAISILLANYALRFAIVPYVISIKRLGVVLGTFAGILYFREKENIFTRSLGFIFVTSGAILITLYGKN